MVGGAVEPILTLAIDDDEGRTELWASIDIKDGNGYLIPETGRLKTLLWVGFGLYFILMSM
jgi:hypothetical protein